ncbi:hypothetical protein E4T63_25650 [Pseudomonas fluorescens]|uniref:Uncharacterized protein n=1 Tax=Pseudomonas fluorescens TaxID=294 RepID=A0AAP9CKW7_PSEFL|nr:hypothetical protein E4T63_25650 [Pseudomonas fluorescens]
MRLYPGDRACGVHHRQALSIAESDKKPSRAGSLPQGICVVNTVNCRSEPARDRGTAILKCKCGA